jgi:hypothetical protein
MSYKLRRCFDNNEWNRFVLTSPQDNLFCRTDFLDAFQQKYDILFVVKGELILLGVVIITDSAGKPVKNPFMYQGILFSEYIELLSAHKKIKICLDSIQFLLIELESIYGAISLSLHHSLVDLRGFTWHNYHNKKGLKPNLELNYTGILRIGNIENFDQILANARTVRRQEYNKCKKNGFKVEESLDVDILNSLHAKTFERQGINRSDSEVFLATELAKESLSKGFGRLLVCKDKQGIPAAASLFLFDGKTGYYLIAANDPDYRKDGSGGYVVFEQIRHCIEQGLSYVDFVGINSPMRGDFKTSFNSEPLPYYLYNMR